MQKERRRSRVNVARLARVGNAADDAHGAALGPDYRSGLFGPVTHIPANTATGLNADSRIRGGITFRG